MSTIITICMFCKRRKVEDGWCSLVESKWIKDDNPNRTELVSHGLCSDCDVKEYGADEQEEQK